MAPILFIESLRLFVNLTCSILIFVHFAPVLQFSYGARCDGASLIHRHPETQIFSIRNTSPSMGMAADLVSYAIEYAGDRSLPIFTGFYSFSAPVRSSPTPSAQSPQSQPVLPQPLRKPGRCRCKKRGSQKDNHPERVIFMKSIYTQRITVQGLSSICQ